MTLQEYAATLCSEENVAQADNWGEVVRVMREEESRFDVKPPDELLTYHQARVAAMAAAIAFAEKQPSGDEVNPYLFITDPSVFALALAIGAEENGLDASTHAVLVQHGCIDET